MRDFPILKAKVREAKQASVSGLDSNARKQNRFYAFRSRDDQESSPEEVTARAVATAEDVQNGSSSRATSRPVVKTPASGKVREDAFKLWRPSQGGLATGPRTTAGGEDHNSCSLP
uniref:Uncharacterized protein n=1 Tax=Solanum tuberosum TaxID=4113 RepID=M1DR16_SOLTU